MNDDQRRAMPAAAALVLDDAATFWAPQGVDEERLIAVRWRAAWFREHADDLLVG